jgi:hypothetical protein
LQPSSPRIGSDDGCMILADQHLFGKSAVIPKSSRGLAFCGSCSTVRRPEASNVRSLTDAGARDHSIRIGRIP